MDPASATAIRRTDDIAGTSPKKEKTLPGLLCIGAEQSTDCPDGNRDLNVDRAALGPGLPSARWVADTSGLVPCCVTGSARGGGFELAKGWGMARITLSEVVASLRGVQPEASGKGSSW